MSALVPTLVVRSRSDDDSHQQRQADGTGGVSRRPKVGLMIYAKAKMPLRTFKVTVYTERAEDTPEAWLGK